jgi:flagellar export protein FliJ
MAQDLSGLIRIRAWQADNKRREYAELVRYLDNLHEQSSELEKQIIEEQATARSAPQEGGVAYHTYARRIIDRRHDLKSAIVAAEAQVATAMDELAEAYRELKTSEIVQRNRARREASVQERRDQEILDEIALQCFRRRSV